MISHSTQWHRRREMNSWHCFANLGICINLIVIYILTIWTRNVTKSLNFFFRLHQRHCYFEVLRHKRWTMSGGIHHRTVSNSHRLWARMTARPRTESTDLGWYLSFGAGLSPFATGSKCSEILEDPAFLWVSVYGVVFRPMKTIKLDASRHRLGTIFSKRNVMSGRSLAEPKDNVGVLHRWNKSSLWGWRPGV